jgi:hypothetical protein
MMKKAFFYMKEAAFKKMKLRAHSLKSLKRRKSMNRLKRRKKYLMIIMKFA